MGVNALKTNLGTSREEAQLFYNEYFRNFDGLAKYLENVKIDAERLGYTETFFGRRRYFEGLRSKVPFIKAMAERMAINAPIQGTEADVVKIAMAKVNDYLEKEKLTEKVSLILQVHDELVYEIEESLVEKVAPKIKEIMETLVSPKETEGVALKVGVSVGDDWKSMKGIV